jgi:hypothetical protein
MYLGLTGGIGSGKSTAARMFADLGAIVIDADAIAKEVLEPGQVGYELVINNFGEEILDSSGNIDVKAENVAIGSESSPQITVSAGSDTARVHAGKVFLGTSDIPSNSNSNQAFGVLVSPKVYSIIAGLALDLGALAGSPTAQGVLFPQTYTNLTRLIGEAGTDAITLGLFSKTVFVTK